MIGVKAIHFQESDGCKKCAFGVFEPEDGQSMILFKFKSSDDELKTYILTGHETGYGCSIRNQHLAMYANNKLFF